MIDTEKKKYIAELCVQMTGHYPKDVVPCQVMSYPKMGNTHPHDRIFYVEDFISETAIKFRQVGPSSYSPFIFNIDMPLIGVKSFDPPMCLASYDNNSVAGSMCYHLGGVLTYGVFLNYQATVYKGLMLGYECVM